MRHESRDRTSRRRVLAIVACGLVAVLVVTALRPEVQTWWSNRRLERVRASVIELDGALLARDEKRGELSALPSSEFLCLVRHWDQARSEAGVGVPPRGVEPAAPAGPSRGTRVLCGPQLAELSEAVLLDALRVLLESGRAFAPSAPRAADSISGSEDRQRLTRVGEALVFEGRRLAEAGDIAAAITWWEAAARLTASLAWSGDMSLVAAAMLVNEALLDSGALHAIDVPSSGGVGCEADPRAWVQHALLEPALRVSDPRQDWREPGWWTWDNAPKSARLASASRVAAEPPGGPVSRPLADSRLLRGVLRGTLKLHAALEDAGAPSAAYRAAQARLPDGSPSLRVWSSAPPQSLDEILERWGWLCEASRWPLSSEELFAGYVYVPALGEDASAGGSADTPAGP